jgi:spoIIIJ-associated protein
MEEEVEIAKEFTKELTERMGVEVGVEGFLKEGILYIDVRGDQKGVLIGKHGHTLDSLQMIINRMVNKRLKTVAKVALDVDDYRKRRADNLAEMAVRLGEKAKRMGRAITAGPFNARERRIIHVTLKDEPFLKTESLGEGELKKIAIIPEKEKGRIGNFE